VGQVDVDAVLATVGEEVKMRGQRRNPEAFAAVFDFIEGDVASTPRDTFNDAADALESVGREIKCLF
jgi:hypothetical protein